MPIRFLNNPHLTGIVPRLRIHEAYADGRSVPGVDAGREQREHETAFAEVPPRFSAFVPERGDLPDLPVHSAFPQRLRVSILRLDRETVPIPKLPGHAAVPKLQSEHPVDRRHYHAEESAASQHLVLGGFLVTSLTPGLSALQFQKMIGIKRYETAFNVVHKLRTAMVRPERDSIGGEWPVELDETYVGGETQGEGRGRHHKTLVGGIVEVRPRNRVPARDPNLPSGQRPQHRGGHGRGFIAGRLRLQVLSTRMQETLEPFVQTNVRPGTEVRTDGWTGYDNLQKLGYRHKAVAIQGDHTKTDQHLPMIHIVFGNLDAWLLGTHHGVSAKHLQSYLNEFVFRFNRRFWPMAAFVLKIAARVEAPTYAELYKRTG